jgi:hypothetical protein
MERQYEQRVPLLLQSPVAAAAELSVDSYYDEERDVNVTTGPDGQVVPVVLSADAILLTKTLQRIQGGED